jgi:hypothetical protein
MSPERASPEAETRSAAVVLAALVQAAEDQVWAMRSLPVVSIGPLSGNL